MDERVLDVSDGDDLAPVVSNSSDGELLVVPPGTYEWNSQLSMSRRNWGIRGDGDVTIYVPGSWGTDNQSDRVLNVSGDNILLENLVFDSDGRPGTGFRCIVDTVGTIRDLEIASDGPRTWTDHTYAFAVGAESSNGHFEMDGIVCHNNGDLSNYNGGNGRVGIWCSRDGTLTVRNSVFSGFPNNAIYTRMRGAMEIENCVFANNSPTGVRLGGSNEVIRNCTFFTDLSLDGTTHSNDERRINASAIMADNRSNASSGGYVENCSFVVRDAPRASGVVRFLENDWVEFSDCQFLLEESHIPAFAWHNSGEAILEDVSFHTPSGSGATVGRSGGRYDTSNVGIATGLDTGSITPDYRDTDFDWDRVHDYPGPSFDGGSDGSQGDEGPSIDVVGLETDAPLEGGQYLTVRATLVNPDEETASSDVTVRVGSDSQAVDDDAVSIAPGETETVELGYETASVQQDVEVPVRVETDGDEGSTTVEVTATDEDDRHTLQFDGEGNDDVTAYRFTVDGEIERSDELSEYGTGGEFVDESTIDGWVRGGVDGFEFTGALTALEIDGEATSYVDGEAVDPAEYGGETDSQHTLQFDGEGSDDVTEYQFIVDGEIERSEELSEYGTGGEFVDESTIDGWVRGGVDGFEFTGELTALEVDGEATPYLDGEAIDPADYGGESESPEPEPASVTLLDTNAPVDGGEWLTVTVELDNPGPVATTADVDLVVGTDPQVVDAASVTIDGDATETIELGYETFPVRQDVSFPVAVESDEDADSTTVEVFGIDG
ncbi:right-handed parallel beta-helix repeat-containing protein [Natrialbaceae archaeon AArc-T1-2]|uniref:right-handed parallel beta-helix repeat-containing protein n=1 Tax=Natrialbaceae archaeon AArc-T1-2 TaxID=3053904 RepID=UPI00255AF0BD|nr:right-handed parallel beta-helix repeat-containing protein [Natrialbaceae archaeon AArc-T1-2]WIV67496.1 right-handed parallel beta-helix repeat-containing protein [Natrialbaceae archaeon AArc-T1-2]